MGSRKIESKKRKKGGERGGGVGESVAVALSQLKAIAGVAAW